MKKINRTDFLDFILSITRCDNTKQEPFLGKNIHLIMKGNELIYQLEFIPATSKYFETILLRGASVSADCFNKQICKYITDLKLDRNIIIDTETIQTII